AALPSTSSAGPAVNTAGLASGTTGAGTGAVTASPPPANAAPGQVVVGGKVPDEATKAAVLARLRETYGAANVVDQIEVADVA
ncbi:OmpA family protein, partial [Mesorhizobium sp. M2D.F.Ca.ET.140.01.1.1]